MLNLMLTIRYKYVVIKKNIVYKKRSKALVNQIDLTI